MPGHIAIVIDMIRRDAAQITVARLGGGSIDMRWASGLIIPQRVRIDVVDLGSRADVSVLRDGDHVGGTVDIETGESRIQSSLPLSSALVRLAVLVLDFLLESRGFRGAGPLMPAYESIPSERELRRRVTPSRRPSLVRHRRHFVRTRISRQLRERAAPAPAVEAAQAGYATRSP